MKISEIYSLFVQAGIDNDPRGREKVEIELARRKKKYEKMSDDEKKFYDTEELSNPYSDTRILHGDCDKEVRTVMVGVDVETPELLLVDRLREKGEQIDFVIMHHPVGKPLADLHKVMGVQEDILAELGVPINVAQGLMHKRMSELERMLMPGNHMRETDAAKLLGIPMMCVHTPADNCVHSYLQKELDKKKPQYVEDVMEMLESIDEYAYFKKLGMGPKLTTGSLENRCGKIMLGMTGGTSGAKEIIKYASDNGVGTVIDMHMGESHFKEAEKAFLNIVIAGHMSSDSLGMNCLLDMLEDRGVRVVTFSGLYRAKRSRG